MFFICHNIIIFVYYKLINYNMKNKKYVRFCSNCGKELTYRSYSAFYNANKKESLCRNCGCRKDQEHSANLNKLLEDTPEAFYWIGFILSDGCIYDGRLTLRLQNKDKDQVLKFGKFVEYTGSYGTSKTSTGVSCMDKNLTKAICEKFDIHERKTYNPPTSILKFESSLLIALLAGFIDGDGRIANQTKRKDFFLTIKVHSSWLNILKEFNSLICEENFCKINSKGYAVLTITNTETLKRLKTKVLDLNLPILSRKWDIIDMNFVSKYVTASLLRNKVIELYLQGKKNKEISEECKTSQSNVSKIIKNYKNDN